MLLATVAHRLYIVYRQVFEVAQILPFDLFLDDLIPASIHYEYDAPLGIGAFPSEIRLRAPMPWGEIVFMMNTRRDYIA